MKKFSLKVRGLLNFIHIDYSFVVLMLLAFLLDVVKLYFLYVFFIILHEVAHMIVAKHFGYLPEKLKLTMFGASLEGFDDFLLFDEIKIIVAGPLFNLFVVIGCYLSFWFYPETFEFLNDILLVNQSILIFNLLPIFPLDAGRILLCCLAVRRGRRGALILVKKFSLLVILVMFCVSIVSFFFLFNFALGFASVNLCVLLFESSRGTSFKREVVFRKKLDRLFNGIVEKRVYIRDGYPSNLLLKFIDGEHYFRFIFVDENFSEVKQIDEYQLMLQLGFI